VPVDPAPATFVGSILTAVRSFNQARIGAVLDDADASQGIDATIDEIVFPSLRVVGTFWSSGTIDVAHEHLLSTAVARWVAARSAVLPGPGRNGTILLAAGPQDMHTLALDCLDLLLAARGVEVCNLGAQTPVASLLLAARAVHATAVVVSSHTPTVASHAVRSIKGVAEAGLPAYFAGSSFASQFFRQHTPGVPLDGTLAAAAEMLTTRHTTPPEPASLPHERFRQSAAATA
jgi:methanogenic corrinoid protein MtbC1